jgi:hypothetical protein
VYVRRFLRADDLSSIAPKNFSVTAQGGGAAPPAAGSTSRSDRSTIVWSRVFPLLSGIIIRRTCPLI